MVDPPLFPHPHNCLPFKGSGMFFPFPHPLFSFFLFFLQVELPILEQHRKRNFPLGESSSSRALCAPWGCERCQGTKQVTCPLSSRLCSSPHCPLLLGKKFPMLLTPRLPSQAQYNFPMLVEAAWESQPPWRLQKIAMEVWRQTFCVTHETVHCSPHIC